MEQDRTKRRQYQQRHPHPEEGGCGTRMLLSIVKFLHIMDGMVGLSLLIYGFIISNSSAETAVAFVYVSSALLLIRAVLGLAALYTTWCQRYGLVISAHLSPVFSILLFIMSMLCWGLHKRVFGYLEHHAHQLYLPMKLVRYWEHHEHFVWLTLLVFSVLELLRWLLVNRLRERLLWMDDSAEELASRSLSSNRSSSRRPWWWRPRRDDGLDDPLLSRGALSPHWSSVRGSAYEMRDGVLDVQNNETKRRWFSRFFARNKNEDDDLSSVDFASVHEEWASRSEEDPLWWSREEEEEHLQEKEGLATSSGADESTEENKDASWVEHTTV